MSEGLYVGPSKISTSELLQERSPLAAEVVKLRLCCQGPGQHDKPSQSIYGLGLRVEEILPGFLRLSFFTTPPNPTETV